MIKPRAHRFLLPLFFLLALSPVRLCSVALADEQWKPVTAELLKNLHLDRDYHKCIAVADGDTVILEKLGAIRFIGVDTPEKNHPGLPVQFMSKESSAFTKKLCLGKNIRLEYDSFDEDKRGSYGRILAYLYLEDGTFVQEQLLMKGHAAAYTKYPFDKKRKKQFLAWEQKAQERGLGLWKNKGVREALWILKERHLHIRVEKVSSGKYRLWIGNRSSRVFPKDEISLNLVQLYRAAHELSPRDLKKQLARLGYEKKTTPELAAGAISIMGMAHKKWGVTYGNHVKPRVPIGKLDGEIQELSRWITDLDPVLLGTVLAVNGYHRVPGRLIQAAKNPEIAEAFLETEPIGKRAGGGISWESAEQFIGKRVTVHGKIVRSFNSGKACFLNFHRNFTRYMGLTIFNNAFRKFPFQPEKFYLNKTVRVRGQIKMYKGRPEIVLENPKQIEVVKDN